MIAVVGGVIRREGRILLSRRIRGADAGKWEFPGGKLERGETPEQALTRELREELGIEVSVGSVEGCVADWQGAKGEGILLMFYGCEIVSGEPECLDCGGVMYVLPEELAGTDLAANDRIFVNQRFG